MVIPPHKKGFSEWAWQRGTAIYMTVYSLGVLIRIFLETHNSPNFTTWKIWLSPFYFRVFSLFFIWALSYHAWLGMKKIALDYIPNGPLRIKLQWLFKLSLMAYVLWGSYLLETLPS
jgi:succinate dehydrogenase / fumarate reductase membrane anchor subunit